MSEALLIEVPVTRVARTTRIGRLLICSYSIGVVLDGEERLRPLDKFALRTRGGGWRPGLGRVDMHGNLDVRSIVAPSDEDTIYRVEPE